MLIRKTQCDWPMPSSRPRVLEPSRPSPCHGGFRPCSSEKANVPNVDILVPESGWPLAGNRNFTTSALAQTYNQNYWKLLKKGAGTPRRPNSPLARYIFAMFNEDLKQPVGTEQSFAFYLNGSAVYPVFG